MAPKKAHKAKQATAAVGGLVKTLVQKARRSLAALSRPAPALPERVEKPGPGLPPALLRPGGLLEAMRQRGTLPAFGVLASSAPAPARAAVQLLATATTFAQPPATVPPRPERLAVAPPVASPHARQPMLASAQQLVAMPALPVASLAQRTAQAAVSSGQVPQAQVRVQPPLCMAQAQAHVQPVAGVVQPPQHAAARPQLASIPPQQAAAKLQLAAAQPPQQAAAKQQLAATAKPAAKAKSKGASPRAKAAAAASAATVPSKRPAPENVPMPNPKICKVDASLALKAGEPTKSRAAPKRPPVPSFARMAPAPQAPPPQEPWLTLRDVQLPAKRAEDNYEISDKGEDSEAEEPDRSHKRVPKWSSQYLQLIEKQAGMDPDTIFGPHVPKCDLLSIFSDALYARCNKERPKRKRGSSGEWKQDLLSAEEVGEYKKKMGQHRRWEVNAEPIS